LAVGPAYTFELEADLDEQSRLLDLARGGHFPATTGRAIALLGGSYSSLHVQRLLQRGQENLTAALLLGPPTDMFEMRRLQENGSHLPPFGLDQAFIAVGLPDQEPLRYWHYSGAYHVRADFPPIAILHSRDDQVVPYQQSELLARHLDLVGAPHEDFYFDGASHYLMAPGEDKTTQKIYDFALDFLARRVGQK
jgi:acetyl esterase/lipase